MRGRGNSYWCEQVFEVRIARKSKLPSCHWATEGKRVVPWRPWETGSMWSGWPADQTLANNKSPFIHHTGVVPQWWKAIFPLPASWGEVPQMEENAGVCVCEILFIFPTHPLALLVLKSNVLHESKLVHCGFSLCVQHTFHQTCSNISLLHTSVIVDGVLWWPYVKWPFKDSKDTWGEARNTCMLYCLHTYLKRTPVIALSEKWKWLT